MARLNKTVSKTTKTRTHGGAPATIPNATETLRRSVLACMLWEDQFYEDGKSIADRISLLVPQVKAEDVAELAVEAREDMKLRHVPLLLVREMARTETHKHLVADTLFKVIQRPDELAEFVAIYWKDGKQPLSNQVKKGLARAFTKFDEYSLDKYNLDGAIKLRDVLFLVHAKPQNKTQERLWKRLVDDKLKTADTWETELSAGKGEDKKDSWTRLLKEEKLGGLAFLRNLRNMIQAGVSKTAIKEAFKHVNFDRVLPFRFLTAAKHAPDLEPELEKALFGSIKANKKLSGKTVLIVDVSGSMYGGQVSEKSELSRADAACALALLVRELCDDIEIYATAGNDGTRIHDTAKVPSRRGFALSDFIYNQCRPLGGGGIFLKQVTEFVKAIEGTADRIIVITDEQDCDSSANAPSKADAFGKFNYILNVGSYDRGIGYGKWTHISGWSEAVLDFIAAYERDKRRNNK